MSALVAKGTRPQPWRRSALGVALVLSAACAASPGKPEASAPKETTPKNAEAGTAPGAAKPVDFEAMMRRETGELTLQAISGPAGAWSARVLASGAPRLEVTEGIAVVSIPIGTDTPLICQVMPDSVDAGAIIGQALAAGAAKVSYQRIAPTGIKVVAAAPAAFIDAIYFVNKPGPKAAGYLKMVSYPKAPFLTFCLHDEPGFRGSFEKVAASFFESFKLSGGAPPEPQYAEVGITSIANLSVGFQTIKVTSLPNAQRRVTQYSASFLPASPKDLIISDEYTVETTDGSGRLVEGVWVSAQGGEIQRKVKLSRGKGARYTFSGEVSGKPISGEFAVKDAKGLASTLSTASDLKSRLAQSKPFSFKLEEYHPDLDPTRPIVVGYSREASAGQRAVLVKLGEVQAQAQVDAQGLAERVELQLSGRTLLMKREYFQGQP